MAAAVPRGLSRLAGSTGRASAAGPSPHLFRALVAVRMQETRIVHVSQYALPLAIPDSDDIPRGCIDISLSFVEVPFSGTIEILRSGGFRGLHQPGTRSAPRPPSYDRVAVSRGGIGLGVHLCRRCDAFGRPRHGNGQFSKSHDAGANGMDAILWHAHDPHVVDHDDRHDGARRGTYDPALRRDQPQTVPSGALPFSRPRFFSLPIW